MNFLYAVLNHIVNKTKNQGFNPAPVPSYPSKSAVWYATGQSYTINKTKKQGFTSCFSA